MGWGINIFGVQIGGGIKKKLKKNIIRLYNCYVLSQNQNQDKLSFIIKKRLDNKIIELKNLEGGTYDELLIKNKLIEIIFNNLDKSDIQQQIKSHFILLDNIIIKNVIKYIILNKDLKILEIYKQIYHNNNQVAGAPKSPTELFVEFMTINTCPPHINNKENDFKNYLLTKAFDILSVINIEKIVKQKLVNKN